MTFGRKGQATQEVYKDVIRSCGQKTRKVKAQLEFNLATVVKDNNCFYKRVNKKKSIKENTRPFLDVECNQG